MLISNEKGNDKTHRLQMSVTRQDKTRRVAYVSPVNMAVLQEEIKKKLMTDKISQCLQRKKIV